MALNEALCTALVFAILSAIGFFLDWDARTRATALETRGVRAEATVDHAFMFDERLSSAPKVSYYYKDAAGSSHFGSDQYSFEDWRGLHKGDMIVVIYDPSSPETSGILRTVEQNTQVPTLSAAVSALCAIGSLACLSLYARIT